MKRITDWIRSHLPTWAQLVLLSRTVWGYILVAFGFAAERVSELQGFVTALGLPAWTPIALGIALGLYARYSDARSGQNPA